VDLNHASCYGTIVANRQKSDFELWGRLAPGVVKESRINLQVTDAVNWEGWI
jgi:hypothetical protein